MNYARTFIGGNITREPELRATPGGMNVVEFVIAVGRQRKDKKEIDFLNCKAFDRTAENLCRYFHKGSAIFVEARPQMERWLDTATGKDRSRIIFVVDRFEFCGKGTPSGEKEPPMMTPPAYRREKEPEPEPAEIQEEIPF